MSNASLTTSVVIPTYNRPDYIGICLEHLLKQTVSPIEITVVDASTNEATAQLITAQFPSVRYLRNPRGSGSTGTSRNIGLRASTGDIIAFVDDDAYPRPDWLAQLLDQYGDPAIGAVGGRVSNGIAGEEVPVGEIGRLRPDGTLTGNFSTDPGAPVRVDHLLGANMSFRRQILLDNGGIHDAYPGPCLREETDISLRVGRAGWGLIYTPTAVVDHVSGPYAKGHRFDRRYHFYAQRNHVVLLHLNFGVRNSKYRRYFAVVARDSVRQVADAAKEMSKAKQRGIVAATRSLVGSIIRVFVSAAGLIAGVVAALQYRRTMNKSD